MATKPKTRARSRKSKANTAPVVKAPEETLEDITELYSDRLTPRRRAFAYEYLKDRNGTQAAIRAGYSPESAGQEASRLLKNVNILEIIEDAERRAAIAANIDAQYVLAGAVEVAERCLQRYPVMEFDKVNKVYVQSTDEDGNHLWTFDASGAMKAFTLISKHTGGFKDQVEHSLSPTLEDVLHRSRIA